MDIIDKTRITKNLVVLLKETQYHALISSIERLDKKNLIPEKLMTFWKKRPTFGYNLEQLNRQFYSDIQCRGPEAFQLLIKGLQESGHQNMVKLLVPTLRIHESESDEVLPVEYYDNEGTNFAFIDDNWKGIPCRSDREAIKLFFAQLGYRELRVLDDLQACGDIASLVVVNFSSFSNGGISQETEWIYDRFNQESLASKPKILISLRYLNKKLNDEVQQDNGGTKLIRKFFRDMLQVKITVDSSKRHDGEKSEEVRHLLRVFSEDDSLHLEDKIRKLQGEFKRNQLHPLEMQDSDFSKAFRLKKC